MRSSPQSSCDDGRQLTQPVHLAGFATDGFKKHFPLFCTKVATAQCFFDARHAPASTVRKLLRNSTMYIVCRSQDSTQEVHAVDAPQHSSAERTSSFAISPLL